MSVVHALVIAPCLLPSNGSELIGIKKCKNIMYHLQEPLATTELTCYVLYEWSMAETNIYHWVGTEMMVLCMPLWTKRIVVRCTMHYHKKFDILLPSAHNNQPLEYPTQSAWWYMLKQTYILYNELGDMSSCTSAMWQYEPRYAQITNENWVIFFNFTQQSTLLQRYLWDERSLMDAWDQVVLIMRNHIIQTVNGAIDHSEVV